MKQLTFVAFIFVTLITGCTAMTQQIRGNPIPTPSVGFRPTNPLPYPTAKVFKAVVETLHDARVSILTQSKKGGRIATDYVAGPTQIMALGLPDGNSLRYKYLVTVKGRGGKTKLMVTAYLESSGNEVQLWRDVSADNQQVVASIQDALIENIEKHLK